MGELNGQHQRGSTELTEIKTLSGGCVCTREALQLKIPVWAVSSMTLLETLTERIKLGNFISVRLFKIVFMFMFQSFKSFFFGGAVDQT